MKKLFTLISLVFVLAVNTVFAQLINPNFELWTNDIIVPTAMNPNAGNGTNGWWDYNFFNYSLLGSSPISLTRCTDTVHSGTYSARLKTVVYTPTSWNLYKNWGIPFIFHEYNDTLGILFNGNVNATTQTFKPGIPFTQKITQFSFYYQYKPNGNDTAECRVELVQAGNIPVAGGAFKTGVSTSGNGWQHAVIDLSYVSSATPDTLWILFSSSSLDYSPKEGSVFWIDDASITLPTGVIQPIIIESNVDLFPNPSRGIFSIHQQSRIIEPQTIEVYNVLGERVYYAIQNRQSVSDIDISNEVNGVYFLKIANGGKIQTKKIVKQ